MTAPVPTPSPDARAEEIFARTRAAFASRAFPPTIKYKVRISGYAGGHWSGRTYDAFEDWPEATVHTRSISEEEAANPVKPPLFAKSFFENFGPPAPQSGGAQGPDILGFPELAVSYAFGFAEDRAPAPDASADPSGLRTIGRVRAQARNYDVRLAGEETIDGNPCWHLTLRPFGNPGTYRLRDLWVDESSYQTRRLVTDGNFTTKATGSGRWTVSYAQNGDAWYLESEISDKPVDGPGGSFERVEVQFLDVAADPHENLDFGIAGSADDMVLTEPSEPESRS